MLCEVILGLDVVYIHHVCLNERKTDYNVISYLSVKVSEYHRLHCSS